MVANPRTNICTAEHIFNAVLIGASERMTVLVPEALAWHYTALLYRGNYYSETTYHTNVRHCCRTFISAL